MDEKKTVVIPREVADVIDEMRASGADNETVVYNVVNPTTGPGPQALRKLPFDTLMRALLDGYQRELTEEEKREKAYAEIREKYDRYYSGPGGYSTDDEDAAFAEGIEWTLDTLGIRIEGVNA